MIVHLYRCKILLHAIHIYRSCSPCNEDVLREKHVFYMYQFLLKGNDCFQGQAEVSISVVLGYHSFQPHIAMTYRKRRWFATITVGN